MSTATMTGDQWKKLTPSHQAELWPSLSDEERTAILTIDKDALRTVAAHAAQQLATDTPTENHAPRSSALAKPSVKPMVNPADRPVVVGICYFFSIISVFGALAWVVAGMLGTVIGSVASLSAIGCLAGAVLWWVLGDIRSELHELRRR